MEDPDFEFLFVGATRSLDGLRRSFAGTTATLLLRAECSVQAIAYAGPHPVVKYTREDGWRQGTPS